MSGRLLVDARSDADREPAVTLTPMQLRTYCGRCKVWESTAKYD